MNEILDCWLYSSGWACDHHHSAFRASTRPPCTNMASPSTVTGTVKRFEWTNPHAYIYLEA